MNVPYMNKWKNLDLPRLDSVGVMDLDTYRKERLDYPKAEGKVAVTTLTSFATRPDMTQWFMVTTTTPDGEVYMELVVDWNLDTTLDDFRKELGVVQ